MANFTAVPLVLILVPRGTLWVLLTDGVFHHDKGVQIKDLHIPVDCSNPKILPASSDRLDFRRE